MIASGYNMVLYCDLEQSCANTEPTENNPIGKKNETIHEYQGASYSECKKKAVRDGWKFNSKGQVMCPMCVKAKKKFPKIS